MGSSPKPGADRLSVPPEAVGAFSSVAASVLRRLTGPSLSGLALALAACRGDAVRFSSAKIFAEFNVAHPSHSVQSLG
jgi:hypothetical protein